MNIEMSVEISVEMVAVSMGRWMGIENAWVNTIGRLPIAVRNLSMTACDQLTFWHDSMPKADSGRKVPMLSTKLLTSNFSTLLFTASQAY